MPEGKITRHDQAVFCRDEVKIAGGVVCSPSEQSQGKAPEIKENNAIRKVIAKEEEMSSKKVSEHHEHF